MERRALIIYCDATDSGYLSSPLHDNQNFQEFLMSSLGGQWYKHEIQSLHNPKISEVRASVRDFCSGADYTLVLYTGHGGTDRNSGLQLLELSDGDISILDLRTDAPKQLMIFDTCREYLEVRHEGVIKLARLLDRKGARENQTRALYDHFLRKAGDGISILYSSSLNQASPDGDYGGYYLLSLIEVAKAWAKDINIDQCFNIRIAHLSAVKYMQANYPTIQKPQMVSEKRHVYFPFAVKRSTLSILTS